MSGLTAVLLGILTLVTYRGVLTADFVYEDANSVPPGRVPLALSWRLPNRSLASSTLQLDYRRSGTDPRGYHATNVAMHVANGLLVGVLAATLVGPGWPAILGAGLFLLHPLNSQAVAYVSARTELLAALGVLIAAVGTVSRFKWRWLLVALGVLVALLSKESAIVVIALVALLAWTTGRWPQPGRTWAGLLLLAGLAGALRLASLWTDPYIWSHPLSSLGYAALQAAAVWRYLWLVVWPVRLSVDHDFEIIPMVLAYVALVGLVAALWGTWVLRKRYGSWPLVACGAWWIVLAVGPRFVMRIPETLTEHQFYVPFVGVSLLAAVALRRVT